MAREARRSIVLACTRANMRRKSRTGCVAAAAACLLLLVLAPEPSDARHVARTLGSEVSNARNVARTKRSLLSPSCRQFLPGECSMRHSSGPGAVPYCHNGTGQPQACGFNTAPLSQCTLWANGRFVQTEGGTRACEPAFMRGRKRPPPACGASCCAGDLPGSFHNASTDHAPIFQPDDSSCLYHEYNSRQVMDCLAGSRLVIAGDSMMRQLFNAAVALFRGQDAVIDYNRHSHARYRLCEAADSLALGSFLPSRWELPLEEIAPLFGSEARGGEPDCSPEALLQVDYLWAPRFVELSANLQEYDAAVASNAKQRIVYVVFAGFWEDKPHVPAEFLATLDTLRASAASLALLSVPRTRLYGEVKDNAALRNAVMREWAAARAPAAGGNVLWLDFDRLAHAPHAPPSLGSLNWHWQCFLDHGHESEALRAVGGSQGAWHWPDALQHLYPSVWTDDAAACGDGMNRQLLQILFNMLCNPKLQAT